jgi:SAM-dependent methyltransferase
MSDLSQKDPLARFSGLAEVYARCRPSYPVEAVDYLMQECALGPTTLLVDVGCGTGISARLFAARGVPVLGIEPNAEMRARAEAEPVPEGVTLPTYRDGRAEATGLADGVAQVVLSAQAFHWFEPDAALREFHRILVPGGWVAFLWNERDAADPFTADYGAVIRSTPEAAAVEMPRARAGEPLLSSPLFQDGRRLPFHNQQALDEDGLLGRTFSASYAPREPNAARVFAEALRAVFARHQQDGKVTIHYETSLYIARRAEARP